MSPSSSTKTCCQLAVVLLGVFILSTSGQDLAGIACSEATRPAVLTDYTGVFSSPNFPQNYPDNVICQWLIVSQESNGWVKLDFTTFHTEATFDIVRVYDGDNENSPLITSFEGFYTGVMPYDVLTRQQYMLVTFTSDVDTNRGGFNATYTSTAPFEIVDACEASSRPLLITDYSGTITTKNYPGNYWNYQTCQWTIESQEPSGTVSISFTRFFTESNSDLVIVFDGPDTSSPELSRLSGLLNQPVDLQTTQQYLTVLFTSNPQLTRFGFTADFTSVPAA